MTKATKVSRFTVGDWAVEPDLDRISRDGESTVLEPRVMELLLYLAEHAGATISTDELADNVWAGRAISDQPVYQGVAQLRKALGDEARRPRYIATITKKGYRLIAAVAWPEAELAREKPAVRPRQRSRILMPFVSLVLAGSFFFLSSSDVSVSREGGNPLPIQFGSIAVLPFVDMSEDQSQQYLGDGLAEEVIHRIAGTPDFRVVARTSSFLFRDREIDVMKIGEQLGADVVLEGSIRRSGDRLRITAQLVNATDGFHIWSQSYEPIATEAFAVQDQIANSVVQRLQAGGEVNRLPTRPWTESANAADAYYLGLFHMHKRRAESLDRAIGYFQTAVKHDRQFALAYAQLARAYFLASDERFGNVPDDEAAEQSARALQMARSLDDRLPEVILSMADHTWDNGDLEEAEALILRAIEVSPNHSMAYRQYGFLLGFMNRLEESLAAHQKAVELDPLSPVLRINLGRRYSILNRITEAEAQFLRAIELDPDWHAGYFWLAAALPPEQMARSIRLLKKAATIEGPDARFAAQAALAIGYRYLTLGDYVAARQWFDKGEAMAADDWMLANHRIHLFLAQDRADEADALLTEWLNKDTDDPFVYSLGGLYRAMMERNSEASALFEAALALPDGGNHSNLFVDDFLIWGYVPAVHLARLRKLEGAVDAAKQLLDQSERYVADFQRLRPGLPGPSYVWASIHALRGDDNRAIAALHEAIDGGWLRHWFAQRDPIMAGYRDDPRFLTQMDRLRARIDAQRQDLVRVAEADAIR